MKNKNFSDILKDIENDNISELSSDNTPHKFSKAFEKQAISVCHGKNAENKPIKRRRIPLWAAALIAILVAALVTGCAIGIYRYFARYIPYQNIDNIDDNVRMYSTAQSVHFNDAEVETVLYIKDGDNGRLMLWLKTDEAASYELGTVVAKITLQSHTYELTCTGISSVEDGNIISAEAENIPNVNIDNVTLTVNDETKTIEMTDITDNGYEVAEWAVVEGITLKIVPLYTNNRIFIVTSNGLDGYGITASITVYDSNGNKAKCGSSSTSNNETFDLILDQKLDGEIVKIEINSLRIYRDEYEKITISLYESKTELGFDLYLDEFITEKAVSIEMVDGVYHLITEISSNETDIVCDNQYVQYDSATAIDVETLGVGKYRITYEIHPTEADEISLTPYHIAYSLYGKDGSLAEINVNKK